MYRYGHYGAGFLVYTPLAFVVTGLGFRQLALGGALVVVALAMLPDQDQRIPLVPHRGPTHTVWFALLVGGACGYLGLLAGQRTGIDLGVGQSFGAGVDLAIFGFLLGTLTICSHIAADALTPMGVRPFSPLSSRRYTYNLTRASNPISNYLLLLLGGLSLGLALFGTQNVVHWIR